MDHIKHIRWTNRGDSRWEAIATVREEGAALWIAADIVIADAVMTGRSGIDDYPWDWGLTDAGQALFNQRVPESQMRIRTSGVADTLRSVKSNITNLFSERIGR